MFAVYRAVVKGSLGGVVQTRTILTFEAEIVAPDTLASVVMTYVGSIFTPVQTYISSVFGITSIDLYSRFGGQWLFLSEEVYGWGGGAGGDALPNFVAVPLIGKGNGIRQIGRKFIPGIAESAVGGNALTVAAVIAFGTSVVNYVSILTTAAGSTLQPGIMDKTGTFRNFSSGVLSPLLGTMRRRKPGLGI